RDHRAERQRRRAIPYISRAEIRRSRWMDLATAVAHVIRAVDCDKQQALRDIEAEVRDQRIPFRWEDQAQPPRFSVGPIAWAPPISDMLPDKFVVDRQMRLKDTTGRFRTFPVLKFAVERLFEQQKNLSQPMELRNASDSEIRKAINEVYDDA